VWGVGAVTAQDLYKKGGFHSVDELRAKVEQDLANDGTTSVGLCTLNQVDP
jgi:hypothetical protein